MRGGSLACVAFALVLAGCGAPEETTGGGGGSGSVWIQTDIAGADIDGDGRTDIVTTATLQPSAGVSDGTLKVYRQTAPNAFVASQIQVGRTPWRVQIADINGDGALDLLVLDVVGGATANDDVLYLLLQDANSRGRFLPPRVVAAGLAANDFVVTDANLDFAPDLVIAGVPGGGTGAAQYLQTPSNRGSFAAPTTLALAGRVQEVSAGDFGGSGRADLVAYAVLDSSPGSNAPGQLVVAASTLFAAPGSNAFFFTPATVLASTVGVNAQTIEVADVDGNGLQDVVVCFTPISAAFQPKISVVLQALLTPPAVVETSIASLSGLDGFVVADLDGDGLPDIATTGVFPAGSPGTVRSRTNLLAPLVTGRYVHTAAIDMPVAMSRIGAADVDGDGLNDLLLLGDGNRAFVMVQSATARGTFGAPRQL